MREAREWVVFELTSRAEQEDPDVVRKSISDSLKNSEVFMPAAVTQVGGDRVIQYLVEGYAFVRLDRQASEYFQLEGTRFVQNVLVKPGSGNRHRRISTVPDQDIVRMRDQIRSMVNQDIGVGDVVRINSGPYRNMRATVFEDIPEEDKVQVYVRLRSKQSLVTLPRSFLQVVERAPLSEVGSRLNALLEWSANAQPIFNWSDRIEPLIDKYRSFERVATWNSRGHSLYLFLTFDRTLERPLAALRSKTERLERITAWKNHGELLFSFVGFYHGSIREADLEAIHGKFVNLVWIDDVLERMRLMWEDLEGLSRALTPRQEGNTVVQNVLVDGHNLAFRCLYAPGLRDLQDSQGRPTGVILGVLNSLKSFKKRFPDATLYVIWDGSSRRRKQKFADYKGNRVPQSMASEAPSGGYDPLRFLKEVIPLFGIRQVWNASEEADDVIASLIKRDLNSENNVIFSTDRDFLQLVSPTTSLLVPAMGARNEVLYDVATVVKTIGVAPSRVVQLRAFYGDDSDNIPGVPRVPKKVLRSLVQTYGSVDAVYQSGLAGLSKGQYERLRSAEPQVRINVDLMTLMTDVDFDVTPPDVDPSTAATRLRELDINPDSLFEAFFGSAQ